MKKPSRLLVAAVTLPFMYGCTAALAQPLPAPALRPSTEIHGVVVGDAETGERVEYSRTDQVEWTDSTVYISGTLRGQGQTFSQRTFEIEDVGAVLVRQMDPNKTSLLVAGVMVGVGVLGAIFFQGVTTDSTVLPGPLFGLLFGR